MAEDDGREVVLKDGLRVGVRAVVPSDETPLLEFLQALSLDARYRRFFSLSPDLARNAHSATCTGASCGLVAYQPGSQSLVGHAGYWATGRGRAELAMAVADELQGRGLGTILLDRIAGKAIRSDVSVLEMDVLPGNTAMLRLLAGSGLPLRVQRLPGALLCELRLGEQRARSAITAGEAQS